MRVLYHVPHLNTVYAGRTIYKGYENAWKALGHEFRYITAEDDLEKVSHDFEAELLFTSLNDYNLKYLNLTNLKNIKHRFGTKVFVNTPFWKSPFNLLRPNEAGSLSTNERYKALIKNKDYGDVFYNVCEHGDPRMEGFEREFGFDYVTLPLAADDMVNKNEYSEKFKAEVSFLGTNLPDKQTFFMEQLFPLKGKYDFKLYGQDWTTYDKLVGIAKKVGQYFNLPILKNIQKPKFDLEDERRIYSSTLVNLNIHEAYQRQYGGDCNERTFKIPLCGGFEVTDNVSCIKNYLVPDKEIVIAQDKNDWFDKIDYYIRNPEKRLPIISAGRDRVLREHTYKNRVNQLIEIFMKL